MPGLTQTLLHRRLSRFVEWIRTESDREDEIRAQAGEIRGRIKGKAEDDGLVVRSTPNSGSFAKRTGIRRHLYGTAEVEGQDVDLPFVVSPKTADGEKLTALLDRFDRYAKASYPDTERHRTKSSVQLSFVGSKLNYDLVPMLATEKEDEQILLRGNGERKRTSVQKHIEFIRGRTERSNRQKGVVKFNDCVRLLKWWKEFRTSESRLVEADDVPTFLIELLAAGAFDELGVRETYAETLLAWFGWLGNAVGAKRRIAFSDFGRPPTAQSVAWAVLDPVNALNNVAERLSGPQIDELAEWFSTSHDRLAFALAADRDGEDGSSLDELIGLFGSPFEHHCSEE
ncbi:MAG TPA: CBASS oligonucleotide cyclase [Myxococcales bacterium]|nr:CBASS oligonucleotide cyclase [Myxococcales bacterium]